MMPTAPFAPRPFLCAGPRPRGTDLERARYLRDLVSACRRRLADRVSLSPRPEGAIAEEKAILQNAERELAALEEELLLP